MLKTVPLLTPLTLSDPAGELAAWAEAKLKVPAGHPLAGQPMRLQPWQVDFLRSALREGVHTALISTGRKNSKTSLICILILGYMVGPLKVPGFKIGILSLTREKARGLKDQVEAIALASGLEGVKFFRTAQPGISSDWASVDILARGAGGTASDFNLSLVDEGGEMVEADRDLVNSMRSAVSARGGLVVTLSIWGRGPFVAELVNRRGQDGVVIHLYQADADAKIDDESQWLKANPGAGDPGIKQLSSLRADCQNAITNPLEQSAFRCNELNLPGVPSEEMLISLTDWRAVTVQAAALHHVPGGYASALISAALPVFALLSQFGNPGGWRHTPDCLTIRAWPSGASWTAAATTMCEWQKKALLKPTPGESRLLVHSWKTARRGWRVSEYWRQERIVSSVLRS